jgi:hypothetical protein
VTAWHLLIHSIPPRPLYLRAKVRQRLERLGAVALKNSVYVLPAGDEALEDLQWLAGEIVAGGGQAYIASGQLLFGVTEEEMVAAFRAARQSDYESLLEDMRASQSRSLTRSGAQLPEDQHATRLARWRRRLSEIEAIDYFPSSKQKETAQMLATLERKTPRPKASPVKQQPHAKGATWVTRAGIKIDRIASAWLVRRFIDPSARFRFVNPQTWKRKEGEVAFDMTGGDYTHEGDRCTFETIASSFALRDKALQKIAEIVHDIDLKDEKYGRAEAAGIRQLLEGIMAAHPGDEARMEQGFAMLDALYRSFESGRRRDARS